MGNNPEQEIQRKLIELELAMSEEEIKHPPAVRSKQKRKNQLVETSEPAEENSSLVAADDSVNVVQSYEEKAMGADLCTFGGLGLTALTIIWLCTHVHVHSGIGFSILGAHRMHIGIFLIPIFIGVSMLFYNFRSRIAQFVTAGSIGLLLFMVLMQLQMYFAPLSLLELVLMILPLCAGISLLLKGHYRRLALTKDRSD
jgi:hypothetical protein